MLRAVSSLIVVACLWLAPGPAAAALVSYPGVADVLRGSRAAEFFTLPAVLESPTEGAETVVYGQASVDTPHRAALLAVAAAYGKATYVPYIWGGSAFGSPETCQACRACIAAKGKKVRLERRRGACQACRECGMDCSHFVNRMFREAGMAFPYVATSPLKRLSPAKIRQKYGLVTIGNDLRLARPGDLILHDRHIVLLLGMHDDRRGDILHVSRSVNKRKGKIGGIEIVRNADIPRFRGRVLRIFRHEAIVKEELGAPAVPTLPATGRELLVLSRP